MNPDCRDGKHASCSGDGWDLEQDQPGPCPCECHHPQDPAGRALMAAAQALELHPPMLRDQYVAALRLYAAEPWRLDA
jgi:hypothetical protein